MSGIKENLKRICELHFKDHCDLKVIDIFKNPDLAKSEHIIVAPMLVKSLSLPLKRLIGDLSDEKKVLADLGILNKIEKR